MYADVQYYISLSILDPAEEVLAEHLDKKEEEAERVRHMYIR